MSWMYSLWQCIAKDPVLRITYYTSHKHCYIYTRLMQCIFGKLWNDGVLELMYNITVWYSSSVGYTYTCIGLLSWLAVFTWLTNENDDIVTLTNITTQEYNVSCIGFTCIHQLLPPTCICTCSWYSVIIIISLVACPWIRESHLALVEWIRTRRCGGVPVIKYDTKLGTTYYLYVDEKILCGCYINIYIYMSMC